MRYSAKPPYNPSATATRLSSLERRVDGAVLDVAVHDRGIRVRLLDRLRQAGSRVAAAALDAGLARVRVGGEVAVQPVHGDGVVVPDREDEHHALERLAHGRHAADGGEVVGVAKRRLLLLAVVVADVVDRVDALDLDCSRISLVFLLFPARMRLGVQNLPSELGMTLPPWT